MKFRCVKCGERKPIRCLATGENDARVCKACVRQSHGAFSARSSYPALDDLDYAALKRMHETAPRIGKEK